MLTLFTIPKPFRGHIGIIQHNAIRSWTLLHPRCELIFFGDDEGTASAAAAAGGRHVPEVARNAFGTPLVSDIFAKAEQIATNEVLCYINSDIIVTDDLLQAVSRIQTRPFLLIGERWDIDLGTPWDFADRDWRSKLRTEVREKGRQHGPTGVDYYIFPKRMWGTIPPFAVGRTTYDNWLIWRARALGVRVIDATRVVMCVHQNHDRTYESVGMTAPDPIGELDKSIEATNNLSLAGGRQHVFTLRNANWMMTRHRLLPALTPWHAWARMKSRMRLLMSPGA
jgi:hypothetical protein